MKKLSAFVLSILLLAGLSLAQDEMSQPMVDISAISTGTGTITDFLSDGRGEETTCALQFDAMDSMDEDADEGMSFACLREAVMAAGLGDTLAGEGSLTVFAPTDRAFYEFAQENSMSLPEEVFADTEMLTGILTYHVVADAGSLEDIFLSQDAEAQVMANLMTVEGSELPIEFSADSSSGAAGDEAVVMVGEATELSQAYVSGTTISVDNGYIIPITEVLMPPMTE